MTKSKKNKRKGILWLVLPGLIFLITFLIASVFRYIFNVIENKTLISIFEITGLVLMFINFCSLLTIPFGIFQGVRFLNKKEEEKNKIFINN